MLDNPTMSIHLLILIYLLIMMMMSHSESRGRSVTTTTRQSPRILAGARHKPNSGHGDIQKLLCYAAASNGMPIYSETFFF